jgi:hypothetical protein
MSAHQSWSDFCQRAEVLFVESRSMCRRFAPLLVQCASLRAACSIVHRLHRMGFQVPVGSKPPVALIKLISVQFAIP